MITVTPEFKTNVLNALMAHRPNFDGSDVQYAKQYGINGAIYSRLKNGENPDGLVRDSKWLEMGLKLDVQKDSKKWVTVETQVYLEIYESVLFCQENAKSFMLVDGPGIGKTYTGKILARKLKNCFYIDGSQAKSKIEFIRLFARTLGIDDKGKIVQIKAQIKYILKILPNPVVIIDEAGDLDDKTFLEIKEIWNDTEGRCGWYMMGADGLENKVQRNINNKKPGFTEIFSRFGERYNHITPLDKNEKFSFYKKLITEVITANVQDRTKVSGIVQKCLKNDSGRISGLRRAEVLVLINQNAA